MKVVQIAIQSQRFERNRPYCGCHTSQAAIIPGHGLNFDAIYSFVLIGWRHQHHLVAGPYQRSTFLKKNSDIKRGVYRGQMYDLRALYHLLTAAVCTEYCLSRTARVVFDSFKALALTLPQPGASKSADPE